MNEYADFDIVQLDRDQARKLELGLALKCLPFSDVSLPLSVTNLPSLLIWVPSKKELPLPETDPLPPSNPSSYPLMI